VAISVVSASAGGGNADNVTICHRGNAVGNEYQQITVDPSAIDGVGGGDHFGEHKGPLVTSEAESQALKDQMIMWGDIIPPLAGVHDGLNWPAGQAILENGCKFVTPPTTTPATTTPATTTPATTTPATTTPATAPPKTAPPGSSPPGAVSPAPGAPGAPGAAAAVAVVPRVTG
jgi:hypothetical protein